MKPPFVCACSECGTQISIARGNPTARNTIYRVKQTGVAYCSDECRHAGMTRKVSASLMGHPYHPPSDDGRERMRLARRGRKPANHSQLNTPELLKRRGEALRLSSTAKAQRERMHAHFKGERSPHWRGGVTPIHRAARATKAIKEWRLAVFERDNYTCQSCGQRGGDLDADHIKPFSKFPELRCELSNGRTLCKRCHRKTPTYGRQKKEAAA